MLLLLLQRSTRSSLPSLISLSQACSIFPGAKTSGPADLVPRSSQKGYIKKKKQKGNKKGKTKIRAHNRQVKFQLPGRLSGISIVIMGVSGHTNPPHETGVLPIKTTAEDGAANGMEDEMRKDEMDAGLKHSETGPCPEASSRGDILSCHGTGDASPRPTGSSSSLSPGDASLGTRESAGCIEGKSPTLSGRSCAQDGRTEHQGASVVGAQSHPEKSTHGGISSSGGLPSPALSQSSYVSFGLMSDGPLGGDAKNETRDEKVDDEEDVERARDVVNRSKGKKAESPAPVQSSSQPAAPQSAQAISNVPWAKDGTSPTTKLPIRFVDCVGRHYIFPWKKAKTWKVSQPRPDGLCKCESSS